MSSLSQYDLSLADGSHWVIAAADETAVPVVERLAAAMRLPRHAAPGRRLWVACEEGAAIPAGDLRYILRPLAGSGADFANFVGISLVIARQVQANGGVLLHGALAAYAPPPAASACAAQAGRGEGVLLAAPSGTGKTTASGRLLPPWRSLCDDVTLVVRAADGRFWAHPWPTWSRFLQDGAGGAADTPAAVPLRALCFLSRHAVDRLEPIGRGQAVTLLVQVAQQACRFMDNDLPPALRRAAWLQRFDNLCALAQAVPAYILHISLDGQFWTVLEAAFALAYA